MMDGVRRLLWSTLRSPSRRARRSKSGKMTLHGIHSFIDFIKAITQEEHFILKGRGSAIIGGRSRNLLRNMCRVESNRRRASRVDLFVRGGSSNGNRK